MCDGVYVKDLIAASQELGCKRSELEIYAYEDGKDSPIEADEYSRILHLAIDNLNQPNK